MYTPKIQQTFDNFINRCQTEQKGGLKIIGFPTGMGKTYNSAQSAIESLKKNLIPIFAAPRKEILKDFESEIEQVNQITKSHHTCLRIVSDAELQDFSFFSENKNEFEIIKDIIKRNIPTLLKVKNSDELISFFKDIQKKRRNPNNDKIKLSTDENIKFYAGGYLKHFEDLDILSKNISAENKHIGTIYMKRLNNSLYGLFQNVHTKNYKQNKSSNQKLLIKQNGIYYFPYLNGFPQELFKKYFAFTVLYHSDYTGTYSGESVNDIENYIITLTTKKLIVNIHPKVFLINGNGECVDKELSDNNLDEKKLNLIKSLLLISNNKNTKCVFYIDEADEFYNEISEFLTQNVLIQDVLCTIDNYLIRNNLKTLNFFIKDLESKFKKGSKAYKDFQYFKSYIKHHKMPYHHKGKIQDLLEIYHRYEIDSLFDKYNNILDDKNIKAFISKVDKNKDLMAFNFPQGSYISVFFSALLDRIGADSKIKNIEEQQEKYGFYTNLFASINMLNKFFESWEKTFSNGQQIDFLEKLNKLISFAERSGEVIISKSDFNEISDENKFLFGNENLVLLENQMKYLNQLVAVDKDDANKILRLNKNKTNSLINQPKEYSCAYILAIMINIFYSVEGFIKEKDDGQNSSIDDEDDEKMLKEKVTMDIFSRIRKQVKKFKFDKNTAEQSVDLTITNNDISFNEQYLYHDIKKVVSLNTPNFKKNIHFGCPNDYRFLGLSYIIVDRSPEDIILSLFNINKHQAYPCPSTVFMMSATSHIESYIGNYNYKYINDNLANPSINYIYASTYHDSYDINEVTGFINHISNYAKTDIFKSNIENDDFIAVPDIKHLHDSFIRNFKSEDNIFTKKYNFNDYKKYEVNSFFNSIEKLVNTNKTVNSLFLISQTTKIIESILDIAIEDTGTSKYISKYKTKNKGIPCDNIYQIDKASITGLDKDIIVVFYDASFAKEIKGNILDINNWDEDEDHEKEYADALENIDNIINSLKKEIFNEDEYKIMLCSSFQSVAKGFNFVTNKNGNDKDFDCLYVALDPFYNNIEVKDNTKVIEFDLINSKQRYVALKHYLDVYGKPPTLEELTKHFFENKYQLVTNEELAHIARIVIQTVGRIERRRNKNPQVHQYIYINEQTYEKIKNFYFIKSNHSSMSSNLSYNNKNLYDKILAEKQSLLLTPLEEQTLLDRDNYNIFFEMCINYILKEIRVESNQKFHLFKEIWKTFKSEKIWDDFIGYIDIIDNYLQPIFVEAIEDLFSKTSSQMMQAIFIKLKNNQIPLSDIVFLKTKRSLDFFGSSELVIDSNSLGINNYEEKLIKGKVYSINSIFNSQNAYHFHNLIFNKNLNQFTKDFTKEYQPIVDWIYGKNPNQDIKEIMEQRFKINDTNYIPEMKFALEFIRTSISEKIFKMVLENNKINYLEEIPGQPKSYEIYDLFVQIGKGKKLKWLGIDLKNWSESSQALYSKSLNFKVNNKSTFANIEQAYFINTFYNGDADNIFQYGNNDILYSSAFYLEYCDQENSPKYTINKSLINKLKGT